MATAMTVAAVTSATLQADGSAAVEIALPGVTAPVAVTFSPCDVGALCALIKGQGAGGASAPGCDVLALAVDAQTGTYYVYTGTPDAAGDPVYVRLLDLGALCPGAPAVAGQSNIMPWLAFAGGALVGLIIDGRPR